MNRRGHNRNQFRVATGPTGGRSGRDRLRRSDPRREPGHALDGQNEKTQQDEHDSHTQNHEHGALLEHLGQIINSLG
jgi:hypothetical protein